MNPPLAFLSYAQNNAKYKAKVRAFALRLRANGVEVILDQWHLRPGADMYHFMERSVARADKVLLLLDPTYKKKADERTGGVGTETQIVTPEIYGNTENTKFIPVLFDLNGHDINYCVPTYLKTRIFVNLANPEDPDGEFENLISEVYDAKPELPPLGAARYPTSASSRSEVFTALLTIQNSLTEARSLITEMMSIPTASWMVLDTEQDVQQAIDVLEAGGWIEQRMTGTFSDERGFGKNFVLIPKGKLTKLLIETAFIAEFNQASSVKAVVVKNIEMRDSSLVSDSGVRSTPESTTGEPQLAPIEQLMAATEQYVAGVKALAPHLQATPEAGQEIEVLAYPVVQALGLVIPTDIGVREIGECLREVARTLPTHSHDHSVSYDRRDMNLGRGAYLIVLSAVTLATAYRKFALLDELIHIVIQVDRFAQNERLLGETRYFYFLAMQLVVPNNSFPAEKAAFYNRLFQDQGGWLIPLLPKRLNPRLFEIEGDFVGDVACAYAWQREYPDANSMYVAGGKYLMAEHAQSLKEFLRRDYNLFIQQIPDFAVATAFLVNSYDQFSGQYRVRLSETVRGLI